MAMLKVVNGSYVNHDAVHNLIHYICNRSKIAYVGALAVNYQNVESAINAFMIVKDIFHKTENLQARHFIVSFSPEEEEIITPEIARLIGYEIAKYYGSMYQIIFAVHQALHMHIHFVCNSTSYVDGRLLSRNEDTSMLANHVDTVIKYFMPVENKI